MVFYLLCVLSLIFTTIYLYYNKKLVGEFGTHYSFQISFYSMLVMILFGIYEFHQNFTLTLNIFSIIIILLVGTKLAIRTMLVEYVLKEVDVGYFELFGKFGLIFMILIEYLFLSYKISLEVFVGFIVFFIGVILTLSLKNTHGLNFKNIFYLITIALLFGIDPFIIRYAVENNLLSLSSVYFFELLIGTILIGFSRPSTVVFNLHYTRKFFPIAFIRMLGAYFAGKAILIGSPTIVELIKSGSMILLFIIPVIVDKKILNYQTYLGVIITFIGIGIIILFK